MVDGTGSPPARADVGVSDGRIVEIARNVEGTREIDASGRLVTPGFIDIHTHYDPQVLWDSSLSPSCWHGVTSVVAGNCGYSIAPTRPENRDSLFRTLDKVEDMRFETLTAGVRWDFETYPEYLDTVQRRGVAINFGGYVGHTPVRVYVMGDEAYERVATDDEVARMTAIVRDSVLGGALGFSTDRAGFHIGDGGRPVPSIVATEEETQALMRAVGEAGRGIIHIAPGERYYSWVYDFQPTLGRPITWSSILTYPSDTTSRRPYTEKLERHLAGRRAGANVWVQVTCRPILQSISMREPTSLYMVPAFSEFVAASPDGRRALYADRTWRAKVSGQLDAGTYVNPRWETFTVSESDVHPELVGRSAASIARERGVSAFDAVADIVLDDDNARFNVVFANDEEDGVTRLLTSEGCVMGLSDAGAHVGQICDAVMPTDFLSRWVRDRALMPVEAGIRKLTGELADVLCIDRGYLRAGAPADVVVLDWDELSTGPIRRVRDMPAGGDRLLADAPAGIDTVLVNGVPIRDSGKSLIDELDELPGAVLRSDPTR